MLKAYHSTIHEPVGYASFMTNGVDLIILFLDSSAKISITKSSIMCDYPTPSLRIFFSWFTKKNTQETIKDIIFKNASKLMAS